MKLEVGKKYLNGLGQIVEITSNDEFGSYPFLGVITFNSGFYIEQTYTIDGVWLLDKDFSPEFPSDFSEENLVKEVL